MKRSVTIRLLRLLPVWLLAVALIMPAHGQAETAPAWRLRNAPSPYLKAHASDRVAWRRWGPGAFAEARRANRPIFLSIGYLACYWCHVLQREVFTNPALARFINRHFIPVLVDRELNPAVDESYMLATEALLKRGGWPNNLFLTPDLKPFHAVIYAPPERFKRILEAAAGAWREQEAETRRYAARVSRLVAAYLNRRHRGRLDERGLKQASDAILGQFDTFHGGLTGGAKHFRAPLLRLLARRAEMDADEGAWAALRVTLDTIARAGVMDHAGGGFHRYAVDALWNEPHFEKMLADQALLAGLFLRAWRIGGDPFHLRTARRTLDYALADLRAPQGGFYSSRDAESEGREGAYYLWRPEELENVLGKSDAAFVLDASGGAITDGELAGFVVPNRSALDEKDGKRFDALMKRLAAQRRRRSPPQRDEKIISGHNGLMITALAEAARLLDDAAYGDAALKAARFVWNNLRDERGRLFRSFHDGKPHGAGTLADYAYLARGLLALFDLTDDRVWLKRAAALARRARRLFADPDGGYFLSAGRTGHVRFRPFADTALPAAQSVLLEVFARLTRRDGDPAWRRWADELAGVVLGRALDDPISGAAGIVAADLLRRGEVGALQYAAGGVARAQAALSADGSELRVQVRLAEGWHVNANPASSDDYVSLTLSLKAPLGIAGAARYPAAQLKRFGFSDAPLRVLQGRFVVRLPLSRPPATALIARLRLQACDDRLCLAPEPLTFRLRPPVRRSTAPAPAARARWR